MKAKSCEFFLHKICWEFFETILPNQSIQGVKSVIFLNLMDSYRIHFFEATTITLYLLHSGYVIPYRELNIHFSRSSIFALYIVAAKRRNRLTPNVERFAFIYRLSSIFLAIRFTYVSIGYVFWPLWPPPQAKKCLNIIRNAEKTMSYFLNVHWTALSDWKVDLNNSL